MIEVELRKVEIPPLGTHLIVEVNLNSGTLDFVLDTGASRSVIDINTLRELDPEIEIEKESSISAGVGSSDLQSFVASIEEFKIGKIIIPNYEIAVMDLSHVKQSYEQIEEKPIFGVIGGDLLLSYNAKIDYEKLSLMLSD